MALTALPRSSPHAILTPLGREGVMATRTIDDKVVTEITTNSVAAATPRHQVGRRAGVV
jgi:hypothetical protein